MNFEQKYLSLLDEHNALKDLYSEIVKENNLLKDKLALFKVKVSETDLKTKDIAVSFASNDPNSYFGDKTVLIKYDDKFLKFSDDEFVLEKDKDCEECLFKFIYRPRTKNLFLRDGKATTFITLTKDIKGFETIKDGNQRGRFFLKYDSGYFEIFSKYFEDYFLAVRDNKILFTNTGEPSKFIILEAK